MLENKVRENRNNHIKKGRFRLLSDEEVREELKKKWIQPHFNDKSVAYNVNCELCQCRAAVSSETLRCLYCNVVCHQNCFLTKYPKAIVEDWKKWVCFYCIDYLDDSRLRYEEEYWELANHERKVQSQIIIAKYWRRYKCRSFYVRFYNNVVRLQITYHVKHRKRDFMLSLQEKLRPIKVRLLKCHNIQVIDRDSHKNKHGNSSASKENHAIRKEHHFYFIITVIDFNQGDFNQSWRINSNSFHTHAPPDVPFNLRCDEKVMIGGVSGFHTIVITLFQMGSGRNHLIGQVHVDLSSNYVWRRGGKFHLNFGPSEFTIKDYSGMDLRADDRTPPCGSLEFEISTYHGMSFECGPCMGTSLEDMIRTLSRLPSYSGYNMDIPTSNQQVKKPEGSSSGATSGSFHFPMKRMWIAIAEGHLYAFGHFGDQLKLSFALAEFAVSYEFKDGNVIFKLIRNGYPDFSFNTTIVGDTLRWKCAFLSSLRFHAPIAAVAMTKSSVSVPNNSSSKASVDLSEESSSSGALGNPPSTRSFDMRLLVDDLIAMEAKLLTQKGYRQYLASINGVKGVLAYSDGHARRFGSTDFSAINQVIDASHIVSSTRNSVNLSETSSNKGDGNEGGFVARVRSTSDATAPSASPSVTQGKHRSNSTSPMRRSTLRCSGAWNTVQEEEIPPPPVNPVQQIWEELEIPDLIASHFSPEFCKNSSADTVTKKPFANSVSTVPQLPEIPSAISGNDGNEQGSKGARPRSLPVNMKERALNGSHHGSVSSAVSGGSNSDTDSNRTSERRLSRRGAEGGFDPLFSKEVRDAFSNKINEENDYDEVVEDSRFQQLGQSFVRNMLTSVAKNKLKKSPQRKVQGNTTLPALSPQKR